MSSMRIMNPRLRWFVRQMQYKLRQNTDKTDARELEFIDLYRLLRGEVNELKLDLEDKINDGYVRDAIIEECADVANYAMMIADKVKNLKGRP